MKVALAFFGITRSLKYTIDSIKTNILKIFTDNNIEYDIFLSTFTLTTYTNIRTKESSNNIDNEEYKLLNPKYLTISDQDEVKKNINIEQYRTKRDPWNTKYNSVDNFILAQYSKSKLVSMIENTNNIYDYIIYIRPDCLYRKPFDIKFFNLVNNKTICIPNFHLYGPHKFNDRFSITNKGTYKVYGDVFKLLLDISKTSPLHSETVLSNIISNSKINFVRINFVFSRIRCDGSVCNLDSKLDRWAFQTGTFTSK